MTRVSFVGGVCDSVAYSYHKEEQFKALNRVDAVAVSEVLADLEVLASNGKRMGGER